MSNSNIPTAHLSGRLSFVFLNFKLPAANLWLFLNHFHFRNNLNDFSTSFLDGIGINPAQTAGEYRSETPGGMGGAFYGS